MLDDNGKTISYSTTVMKKSKRKDDVSSVTATLKITEEIRQRYLANTFRRNHILPAMSDVRMSNTSLPRLRDEQGEERVERKGSGFYHMKRSDRSVRDIQASLDAARLERGETLRDERKQAVADYREEQEALAWFEKSRWAANARIVDDCGKDAKQEEMFSCDDHPVLSRKLYGRVFERGGNTHWRQSGSGETERVFVSMPHGWSTGDRDWQIIHLWHDDNTLIDLGERFESEYVSAARQKSIWYDTEGAGSHSALYAGETLRADDGSTAEWIRKHEEKAVEFLKKYSVSDDNEDDSESESVSNFFRGAKTLKALRGKLYMEKTDPRPLKWAPPSAELETSNASLDDEKVANDYVELMVTLEREYSTTDEFRAQLERGHDAHEEYLAGARASLERSAVDPRLVALVNNPDKSLTEAQLAMKNFSKTKTGKPVKNSLATFRTAKYHAKKAVEKNVAGTRVKPGRKRGFKVKTTAKSSESDHVATEQSVAA